MAIFRQSSDRGVGIKTSSGICQRTRECNRQESLCNALIVFGVATALRGGQPVVLLRALLAHELLLSRQQNQSLTFLAFHA
jgi:hypothetical protein